MSYEHGIFLVVHYKCPNVCSCVNSTHRHHQIEIMPPNNQLGVASSVMILV